MVRCLDPVSGNPLGSFPKEVIQKWRQTFEGKNITTLISLLQRKRENTANMQHLAHTREDSIHAQWNILTRQKTT